MPWVIDSFLSADLLVSDAVIRTQTGREMLRYPTGKEDPLEQPELLVTWHLQYCLRDIFESWHLAICAISAVSPTV